MEQLVYSFFVRFSLTLVLIFLLQPIVQSQSVDSVTVRRSPIVQKYDLRHETPATAVVAGLSTSRQAVVAVLVRGADQELIDEVEGNMKALILNGYERIGLILGSRFSNESTPVISIFSHGHVYAVIEDAKADSYTKLTMFKLVRDAYQEHIIPLLKKPKDGND